MSRYFSKFWPTSVRQFSAEIRASPPVNNEIRGLYQLDCKQVVFLLDSVSKAGIKDKGVWNKYTGRVFGEIKTCSIEDVCSIVRSLCRAGFVKRSLLNAASKRLKAEAHNLPPRMLTQVLSDMRKLNHIDGQLISALITRKQNLMDQFNSFDLPLLLCAFAQTSFRDQSRIGIIGRTLSSRPLDMSPASVATTMYSLALLDCGSDGTASRLLQSAVPRIISDASCRELVNLAFSMVMMDLPASKTLSQILLQLSRQSSMIEPRQAHALKIVESCVQLPDGLRPTMRESLMIDSSSNQRCSEALKQITENTACAELVPTVRTSRLQERLGRFFAQLALPHAIEESIGPYKLDYALPMKIAVEVDGFTHFYAHSRTPTARSELKMRILRAMGWRVVSLPHFEWIPRNQNARLAYLHQQIEDAAGVPLSKVRRADHTLREKRSKKHVKSRPYGQTVSGPPRGKFGSSPRR